MAFELKKIAWLGIAHSTPVTERHGFKPPLPKDRYIGPEENQTTFGPPKSLFFGGIFQSRKLMREAEAIVAKLNCLPKAADNQIARFFDVDLPRLQSLHRNEPEKIEKLLNKASETPWRNLVQVALGQTEGFLKELERWG